MNTQNCGTCEHYDPVIRGVKETKWGWCVKNSTYPNKEGPGQLFPTEAKRAASGAMPEPYIVRKEQIMPNCALYTIRRARPSKQELVAKLLSDSQGKTVLR
jgi:hypothetical protein